MDETQDTVLVPFANRMSRNERYSLLGQRGRVIWFTGLSGSGKSTIAHLLEERLLKASKAATVLDGDSVRLGLCANLDFTMKGRTENLRRIGHVAALMADAGLTVLCAFVSPLQAQRDMVARIVAPIPFDVVFVNTSLSECEGRDPKGLYQKARRGELKNFTGISSPYEAPKSPRVLLDGCEAPDALVEALFEALFTKT